MGTTPTYALPYPELTDVANVPADTRELAERVEAVLGPTVPLGSGVNCAAEVRFCTDASTAANTGQSIAYARYTKIGKTVWLNVQGVVGSAIVVNFALLLPPSAGVAAYRAVGPPIGVASAPVDDMRGGTVLTADLTRIVSYNSNAAVSDSSAGMTVRFSLMYEVV